MKRCLTLFSMLFFVFHAFGQNFVSTKQSAEQGISSAQYNLGLMYYEGYGVLKDYKQAFYWYQKSAEQGIAMAQYMIGYMYYKGEGVVIW